MSERVAVLGALVEEVESLRLDLFGGIDYDAEETEVARALQGAAKHLGRAEEDMRAALDVLSDALRPVEGKAP